jgi:hypothetical protein
MLGSTTNTDTSSNKSTCASTRIETRAGSFNRLSAHISLLQAGFSFYEFQMRHPLALLILRYGVPKSRGLKRVCIRAFLTNYACNNVYSEGLQYLPKDCRSEVRLLDRY